MQDASDPGLAGTYDLVTIFEALHDMARPVEALRTARGLLAEGGSVIVGDEKVAEPFTVPGDELERLNYGFSVLHCLAVGREDEPSAATGTVIRPDTVRRVRDARRLLALRGPADRARLLALLPARGLSPVAALTPPLTSSMRLRSRAARFRRDSIRSIRCRLPAGFSSRQRGTASA